MTGLPVGLALRGGASCIMATRAQHLSETNCLKHLGEDPRASEAIVCIKGISGSEWDMDLPPSSDQLGSKLQQ